MGLSVGLGNVTQVPAGIVSAFAGVTAPAGWLMCYGQAVSRTEYSALFTALSTTYGSGDGSTTFNIPDLRGRAIAGVDNMGGSDAGRLSTANTLGTATGTETVTLTSAESGVPAHSHPNTASFTGNAASHSHTQDAHSHSYQINIIHSDGQEVVSEYLGTGLGYGAARRRYSDGTNNATATNQSTSITPSGSVSMSNANNTAANAASAHSNMQPTIVLNYIIKATL